MATATVLIFFGAVDVAIFDLAVREIFVEVATSCFWTLWTTAFDAGGTGSEPAGVLTKVPIMPDMKSIMLAPIAFNIMEL